MMTMSQVGPPVNFIPFCKSTRAIRGSKLRTYMRQVFLHHIASLDFPSIPHFESIGLLFCLIEVSRDA
jgi:hypothetical protein